jgi:methylmalonyl-CoA mutase N-terminal domain/subunit
MVPLNWPDQSERFAVRMSFVSLLEAEISKFRALKAFWSQIQTNRTLPMPKKYGENGDRNYARKLTI